MLDGADGLGVLMTLGTGAPGIALEVGAGLEQAVRARAVARAAARE